MFAVWISVALGMAFEFFDSRSNTSCLLLTVAMFAGFYQVLLLYVTTRSALQVVTDSGTNLTLGGCAVCCVALTVAFPVVFVAGAYDSISLATELAIYPLLDSAAKVVFATTHVILATKYSRTALMDATTAQDAARVLAQSANQAKQVFLRYILHEARVPLNTIV